MTFLLSFRSIPKEAGPYQSWLCLNKTKNVERVLDSEAGVLWPTFSRVKFKRGTDDCDRGEESCSHYIISTGLKKDMEKLQSSLTVSSPIADKEVMRLLRLGNKVKHELAIIMYLKKDPFKSKKSLISPEANAASSNKPQKVKSGTKGSLSKKIKKVKKAIEEKLDACKENDQFDSSVDSQQSVTKRKAISKGATPSKVKKSRADRAGNMEKNQTSGDQFDSSVDSQQSATKRRAISKGATQSKVKKSRADRAGNMEKNQTSGDCADNLTVSSFLLQQKIFNTDDTLETSFDLCGESDIVIMFAVLDNYIFQLFNNLEDEKSPWYFGKYHVSALEHTLVQCFQTEKEFPVPDDVIEEELREKVHKEVGWFCKAEDCGCDPSISYSSKIACISHLHGRFVSYICMGCGTLFNSRNSASSHGKIYCIFFKKNLDQIQTVPRSQHANCELMAAAEQIADCEDEDDNDDEVIEETSTDDSFEAFVKFAFDLAAKANFRLNREPEDIINSMSLNERFQMRAKQLILKDHLASKDTATEPIEIMGSFFTIYHDKKHAFQVVQKSDCTPISCWKLQYILKSQFLKKSDRYYCDYDACHCNGEYFTSSKVALQLHIQNKNFILACKVCKHGFTTQKAMERHFKNCELPQKMQVGFRKTEYLESRKSTHQGHDQIDLSKNSPIDV